VVTRGVYSGNVTGAKKRGRKEDDDENEEYNDAEDASDGNGDDDDDSNSKVNTYNGQSILVNLKMNTESVYSPKNANNDIN
jgi:hypothetical protein